MNERRTLILMRHGKSAYPDGVPDHDRPLAPRGRREAGLGGDWLRANTPTIDAVLCSTAVRTRETLACSGIDAPAHYLRQLYGATPGTVIDEINRVGDDVATLLIVGHEPTTSSVALILADTDTSNVVAAESISRKFPTSGIAVLQVSGRWAGVAPGNAALVEFQVPR
ncbi:SixA phosphatase family protein [Mycobacterium sp. ML4]